MNTFRIAVTLLVFAALGSPALALSGPSTDTAESDTEYSGKQGGLRIGTWNLSDLNEIDDATYDESILIEGFFKKDLDIRLSVESTASLWRRTMDLEENSLLSSSRVESESYVLPMFTSLVFYPMTQEKVVAPYLGAGIGVALGYQSTDVSGDSIIGQDEGSEFLYGYGYNLTGGIDWVPGQAFGLNLGLRYQNLHFGDELSGDDSFKGLVVSMGVVYRFQQRK